MERERVIELWTIACCLAEDASGSINHKMASINANFEAISLTMPQEIL